MNRTALLHALRNTSKIMLWWLALITVHGIIAIILDVTVGPPWPGIWTATLAVGLIAAIAISEYRRARARTTKQCEPVECPEMEPLEWDTSKIHRLTSGYARLDDLHPKPVVYVASRSRHGAMWQQYRTAWADLGLVVNSTWIDEWEQGASPSMKGLWERCIAEATNADFLVLYYDGTPLKGALVEVGAALAAGRRIYICHDPQSTVSRGAYRTNLGSWINHPLVTICDDPDDAIDQFRADAGIEWAS